MDKNIQINKLAKIFCSDYELDNDDCTKDCTYSDCYALINAEYLYEQGVCIAEDLAAEIFAWIDSMMFDAKIDGKYDAKVIDIARYEAFKKKYIKSEEKK